MPTRHTSANYLKEAPMNVKTNLCQDSQVKNLKLKNLSKEV